MRIVFLDDFLALPRRLAQATSLRDACPNKHDHEKTITEEGALVPGAGVVVRFGPASARAAGTHGRSGTEQPAAHGRAVRVAGTLKGSGTGSCFRGQGADLSRYIFEG